MGFPGSGLHIYKSIWVVTLGASVMVAGCAKNKSETPDAATSSIFSSVEKIFQQPYDSELLRANEMAHEGKLEDAAALYLKTIPRIPAEEKRERAASLVELGDCFTALGNLRQAYESYQKAWEADSGNIEAHLRLAQFLANGGEAAQAAQHASFVLRFRPDDALALGILGGIETAAGHNEQAEKLLRRSLALDPQKPMVAISLAQVYAQENKVTDARKVLREAASVTADQRQAALAWLAVGRLEEQEGNKINADAAYRAAVKADDSPMTNFRWAQFLLRSAKIVEAEGVLKRVDAMRPAEPSALAEARFTAGRTTEALSVLRVNSSRAAAREIEGRLSSAQPEDAWQKYQNLLDRTSIAVLEAELAIEQGDLRNAESGATLALQRSPDSPAAHYVRGVVFAHQDKTAEAKEQWNSALQSEPDYVPAEIALARQNLEEGDLRTADEHISSVVRDEPANLEALCIFARILLRQGHMESATGIAKRAQAVNPSAAEPHVVIGEIAMREQKYGAAFLEYERALLMEPGSAEALNGVLKVYRQGQVTPAVLKKMERVALSPPASSSLLEIAGRLYAAKGMYPEAEGALRHSLLVDPGRASAAVALAEAKYAHGERVPERFLSELTKASQRHDERNQGMDRAVSTLQAMDADKRGDLQKAIVSYESALNAGESSGVAANNLAWDYALQGIKLDEALKLANSAVERDPKNPATLDTLGVVQLKRRRYSEATTTLNKAVSMMSGEEWRQQSAQVYRHLADACAGAGLSDRANDARVKAEAIEKGNPNILRKTANR